MTDADRAAFVRLLQGVHDYYRQDISTWGLQVWWSAMRQYPLEVVQKALEAHATDPKAGQFLPKVADVIRHLQGTHEDRALLAWGKVFGAMQRVGQYQSVAFDDPAIHAAIVDMGGWPKLCQVTMDELPFLQRRFCDTFAAYSRKGGGYEYPATLSGVAAIANHSRGFKTTPPVLIGDQQAAQAVIEGGATAAKTTPVAHLAAKALQAIGTTVKG